jgi:transposase
MVYNCAIMYIRKTTTQKYLQTGKAYVTYRLVHSYRNADGKAKQETLLNLGGDFAVPECDWRLLCDRIEQIQDGRGMLFELPIKLEREASRIAKILNKRNADKSTPIVNESTQQQLIVGLDKDYQAVDVNSLKEDEVRHIGIEHLAHETASKLELPELLLSVGLNQKQANIALASIISRLIVPGSELRAHRYITRESALDEVIGTEFSNLDVQQLYFASDWLLSHKDEIEQRLYLREKELFNLEETITLFDITNTYFEGHPQHEGVKKGRSKEKRSDCGLVSLGLLLDASGFPRKSKILPGNISEPSTLKDMLATLEAKSSTTIIMDAGIATKDNLEYLKAEEYSYIVVKRDSGLVMPEDDTAVIVKDTANNKVTVSLINKSDKEIELYCHSTAKEAKAIEFNKKTTKRFEDELNKLSNNLPACNLYTDFEEYDGQQSTAIIVSDGQVFTNKPTDAITILVKVNNLNDIDTNIVKEFTLDIELSEQLQANSEVLALSNSYTGQINVHIQLQNKLRAVFEKRVQISKKNVTREYDKVAIRIGKLKQQYKSIAHTYDIEIIPDKKKHYAITIKYQLNAELLKNKEAGIYCLSSNRVDLTAAQLWETYTVLTEIESVFRSLKSELGMRPVYHQLEHRIDGHIFISILAYHIIHTIRYQLKQSDINNSWDGIRQIMAIQIRSTTTMDLQNGGVLRVRKTSRVTPEQGLIYRTLKISSNPCGLAKTYFGVPKENTGEYLKLVVP